MAGVRMNSLYIASAYARKMEMQGYVAQLHEVGVESTSTWVITFGIDVAMPDALDPAGNAYIVAEEDIQDISRAEGFLFFSSMDHPEKGRGGRHTEFGIALTLAKPIFIIGRREHVFHSLVPNNRIYDNFDMFFKEHYGTKLSVAGE